MFSCICISPVLSHITATWLVSCKSCNNLPASTYLCSSFSKFIFLNISVENGWRVLLFLDHWCPGVIKKSKTKPVHRCSSQGKAVNELILYRSFACISRKTWNPYKHQVRVHCIHTGGGMQRLELIVHHSFPHPPQVFWRNPLCGGYFWS